MREEIAKIARRHPAAAGSLAVTSTANTVARVPLRWEIHRLTMYLISPVNI
jgi:hypothetical protein